MKKKNQMPKLLYYSHIILDEIVLTIYSSSRGLVWLDINMEEEASKTAIEKKIPNVELINAPELNVEFERQLLEYFRGERQAFTVDLDIFGTDFQQRVWRALMEIPYGATVSYKDIAVSIANPKAVRAVGMANNKNKIPIIIPCHRVVGADRSLVGYGGGLEVKELLLKLEGIKVENQKVVE